MVLKLLKVEETEEEAVEELQREMEVLRGLNHPNIIKLEEVIDTDGYLGFAMPLGELGTLEEYIEIARDREELVKEEFVVKWLT